MDGGVFRITAGISNDGNQQIRWVVMAKYFTKDLVIGCCLFHACVAYAAPPTTGEQVEADVERYLQQFSIPEMIDYTRSENGYMIPPQPKLGLPGTVTYDSSMAVHTTDPVPGTQFPSPSALAASWSIDRAKEYGLAIGYETRELGGQQIIAPGLNLYRLPYAGRAGEYLSGEDPFIGSVLGSAVANAIQVQGTQTVAKHFVANDQEANRHNIDIKVDERTLRELYLPGFEAVVKNSNPTSVMCSFNKLNGDYACESFSLLSGILKNEWAFPGFVMTDFQGLASPLKAALAGTDMEIGGGNFFSQENLLPYIETGELSTEVMRDKVRRNLRALISYGYDQGIPASNGIEDLSRGSTSALNMAREGTVLLRNQSSGGPALLPLQPGAKIAVVGTMAADPTPSPFGSHYSPPTTYINLLTGLRQLAPGSTVDYLDQYSLRPENAVWYLPGTGNDPGVIAEYFDNSELAGDPVITRTEPGVNWNWAKGTNTTSRGSTTTAGLEVPVPEGGGYETQPDLTPTPGNFSARFTGQITPNVTGDQVFKVHADGAYRLFVNNDLVLEYDGEPVALDLVYAPPHSTRVVRLQAGQRYNVTLEYRRLRADFVTWNGGISGVRMSWAALSPVENLAQYDAVVIAAGLNGEYEGEGFDHPFEMPEYQTDLINNLSAANNKTVVVLHGGGAQHMTPWVENTGAVLQAWYPGQNAGQAIAEIVYGIVNPSGKLPISIDRNIEDNPAFPSYPDIEAYRGTDPATEMTYSEGLYLGYRGYDRSSIKPLYPFGYGMSYTTFKYSDLELSPPILIPGNSIKARFKITNTGAVGGHEIAQLYISPRDPEVDRPSKELKGFEKVYLEPGQTRTVEIELDARSFAYFSPQTNQWELDSDKFDIKVGSSSDELPLSRVAFSLFKAELNTTTTNPLPGEIQKSVQVDQTLAY